MIIRVCPTRPTRLETFFLAVLAEALKGVVVGLEKDRSAGRATTLAETVRYGGDGRNRWYIGWDVCAVMLTESGSPFDIL